MKVHVIKIEMEYAIMHQNGYKPWELRKNDRNYQEGDMIHFEVYRGKDKVGEYQREIIYLFEGGKYGLDKDYVIMTLTKN